MGDSTQNRQWISKQDGLDKLTLETNPLPVPREGEVLVKIHAVSLNYRDTEVCMGLYNHHSTTGSDEKPAIVPCSDMSGTIISTKSNLWKEGDQVLSIFNQTHLKGQIKAEDMKSGLGLPLEGVLQEYRVFPEYGVVKKPANLTHEEACTFPIAGVTAWMALNGMRPEGQFGGPNETVLIQGTGGVSINGLLFAKALGMKVIITSSSNSKLQKAKSLGADHTINYLTHLSWSNQVLTLTSSHGADIIFETGGAHTLRQSFSCVSFGGLINSIGYLSGKQDPEEAGMNVNVLALTRNVTLKGILNGPRERFEEMLRFVEREGIKPVVDRVFAFDQVDDALQYLFAGGHFGKVVIRVADAEINS